MTFEDEEYRILLSAMGREKEVCKQVDKEIVREPYGTGLIAICNSINKKLSDIQYKYRWHDLRKNPEDLPNHLERIIFKTNEFNEFDNGYWSGDYDSFSKTFFNDDKQRCVLLGGYDISDVIAWKRIEPCEVDA